MADEPDSIVLHYLRKLDEKLDRIDGRLQEVAADQRAQKAHMAAFLQSELAQDSSIASILHRIDGIERRLDLNS
jgi:hypothetical protein